MDIINFKKVCDHLNDGIYVTDSKGRTVYVNDAYAKNLGVDKEDLLDKNVGDLEGRVYVGSVSLRVLKEKKRVDSIGRLLKKDIPVLVTGVPVFDKDGEVEMVVVSNRNLAELNELENELQDLKETLEKNQESLAYMIRQDVEEKTIIYRSSLMADLMQTIDQVAKTDATVLITGETGTGKELIANSIYQASLRADKPFVKVNCTTIPNNLLESELFGYEPGSFTGALDRGKKGLFELADKGTLLLDEIGDLPLDMQVKLLRAIQEDEIRRVGGQENIPVDVRLITATNLNLYDKVQEGTFREDLYYRLNVIPLHIPPLRERKEDIQPMVDHFLKTYNKKYSKDLSLSQETYQVLYSYSWPGNIRELENIIERLVVTYSQGEISSYALRQVLHLGQKDQVLEAHPLAIQEGLDYEQAFENFERSFFIQSLSDHTSLRKTAQTLGISPSTLSVKCKKYGINIQDYLKKEA